MSTSGLSFDHWGRGAPTDWRIYDWPRYLHALGERGCSAIGYTYTLRCQLCYMVTVGLLLCTPTGIEIYEAGVLRLHSFHRCFVDSISTSTIYELCSPRSFVTWCPIRESNSGKNPRKIKHECCSSPRSIEHHQSVSVFIISPRTYHNYIS